MSHGGHPQNGTRTAAAPIAESERVSAEGVRRLLSDPSLLAHLSDIVSILDRDLRFLYVSRVVGANTMADVLGVNVLDHIPAAYHERFLEAFEQARLSGVPLTIECPARDEYWWETRLVPVQDDRGVPLMFLTSSNITERKRREQELSERETRLRYAIEASGVGTWNWDRHSDQIAWDEGLCRIFGLDPSVAPKGYDAYLSYVHPEDRDRVDARVIQCLETGVYEDFEHRLVRPDGEVRHVLCRGMAVLDDLGKTAGIRGGIFDITDRKRLEEQLRQVQKMDAIGQLTAGIAHNFNNLLSIVLPNLELCRAQAPAAIHGPLADIEHAAKRAIEMVRQLMLFARQEVGAAKAAADLAAIAERSVSICRATFDRRISIELDTARALPSVLARAGEIEQVLLNICINARDALEEARSENPRIRVQVERGERDTVRVSVSDNGPGIDGAVRARLFEPFFTTKDVGRGTGLGLASAYAIVADHQGQITCASELGAGTTFMVELPVAREVRKAQMTRNDAPARRGSETVLFIDDEPLVRRALRAIMEHHGFRVLEAEDGAEGLALVERPDLTVDVILLDRSMPRMSGEQFLARLRELPRRPPVVLLTGYPGAEAEMENVRAVLMKPPKSEALLATLRQVLDATARAS